MDAIPGDSPPDWSVQPSSNAQDEEKGRDRNANDNNDESNARPLALLTDLAIDLSRLAVCSVFHVVTFS